MKKLFIAAMILLSMSLSAFAYEPIIIKDDPGGSVEDNVKWINRIKQAHVPIRVEGRCLSACTFVLSTADLVCLVPTATLGFHAAMDVNGNVLREETLAVAREFYPKALFQWFVKNVIESLDAEAKANKGHVKNDAHFLSADELVEMGVVKACS